MSPRRVVAFQETHQLPLAECGEAFHDALMRLKEQIIEQLLDPGVIAVVRARREDQLLPLAEALVAGGIIAVEITMTTPNAIAAIRQTGSKLGERALIGVGTVLDEATCRAAIAAGAQFVVSPICRRELVPPAQEAGKPVMLGRLHAHGSATGARSRAPILSKFFPPMGLAQLPQGAARPAAAFENRTRRAAWI